MPGKPRVAVIGTVGVPGRYGGFETLAENLVLNLADQLDLTVYCSSLDCESTDEFYEGARLRYLPIRANGFQSILYDGCSLFAAMWKSDVLVVLGVSGGVFLPLVRLLSRSLILTNVDGVEWKREKWGKVAKVVLRLSEWFAVKFSHCVVADNPGIQSYLSDSYGCSSEYIAYGGDHVHDGSTKPEAAAAPVGTIAPYAFSLCRIEPENNVHLILEAFAAESSSLPLVFVGNWDSSDYGCALKEKYSECPKIDIREPTYDLAVLYELRKNAKLYVHGHSAGGTNPSLVEAMSMRIPIVAFDVGYNRYTTKDRALYFKTTEELVDLVRDTPPQDLAIYGEAMGDIANVDYVWEKISNSYLGLIRLLFKA